MMRGVTLELDFRRRPASPWRWLGWTLLVTGAAAAVAVGDLYAQSESRQAAAQSRFDRLNERVRASAPRRSAVVADPQALADMRRANLIIDQLTVPWDELFDAIEAAHARGFVLLSLTPNARDRSVRLTGESRSMSELLAYTDRLAAQPALGQVHLLGYSTAQRDGVGAVSFNLAATWRSPP